MLSGRPDAFAASMTLASGFAMRYIAEHHQVTSSELSRHLQVTRQATSQLVNSLEDLGVVCRAPHPHDRRAQVLLLTAEGEEFLHESDRRERQIEQEWIAEFGGETVAAAKDLLGKFLTSSESPENLLQLSPSMMGRSRRAASGR
jgi:DNA-binding MarR family transcriptional regulator